MALFGRKKEDTKEKKAPKAAVKAPVKKSVGKKAASQTQAPLSVASQSYAHVLVRPRITEKATNLSADNNVYTFEVSPRATKQEIKKAVKEIYKVEPVKVNIAKAPRKRLHRRTRGGVRIGMKKGVKKAYVFLKDGDTLELI